MFGKLTLDAFKHDLIEMGAGLSMFLMLFVAIGYLTYTRRWIWIWREWFTTVDHKKIGTMYIITAGLMLLKGIIDAGMMRAQQVFSVGDSHGYLTSPHFQQLFSAHGTTMIFFAGMGVVFGLANWIVPLQIGARDIAFPFLNSVGFWLFAVGALLVNVSLIVGNFSAAGWVGYPPLSELAYSPDAGVDYWIWSLQISGAGSLLSGINFFVTIFKMRCPGMTLMKMPVFVWSVLASVVLVVFAFPVLTATLWMLSLDRLMEMHFFTSELGGNPMLYVNLFWAWGHPEVYILILPAFGVFSETVAAFSQKRLFGYTSMVWAIAAITVLSFLVWLHHFFTMGAGPAANAFFGIMTMLISVPTGVKIFNWLFTMFRGRVIFSPSMLWFIGFIIVFTTGGMTGVLMSVAPVDFQMHNSLFLIAHFHSMVIGGVLFGFFSGYEYWFPKMMGFSLDQKLGKWACWCWIGGFLIAFFPLYILGLMGATRRLDHYDASTGWQPLFIIGGIGVIVIACGIGIQVLQLFLAFKQRKKDAKNMEDPWNGRTLEWSTSSPPAFYNFAQIPKVTERDAFWEQKQEKKRREHQEYADIHMPKNTGMGFLIAAFSFLLGFGLIWHMFWMAGLGLLGIVVFAITRLCDNDTDYYVPVALVKDIEGHRSRL